MPEGRDADVEALEAMRRGDRRGTLLILMRAHGNALHRYCYKVLRSHPLADDVHQVVFIQAFRDLERFSGESSFRAWLYAIANHRCRGDESYPAGRRRRVPYAAHEVRRRTFTSCPCQSADETATNHGDFERRCPAAR